MNSKLLYKSYSFHSDELNNFCGNMISSLNNYLPASLVTKMSPIIVGKSWASNLIVFSYLCNVNRAKIAFIVLSFTIEY